jgi:bifunctional DNase/RNase
MDHEAEIRGIGISWCESGMATPVVILTAKERYVPIFISPDQAQSIQFKLQEERSERPLTHDLLLEIITELGGALDKIIIDDLSGGTFYAKIHLQRYVDGKSNSFAFDARPSDAIAIAIRADCPILLSESVLDAAGQSIGDLILQEFGSTGWE